MNISEATIPGVLIIEPDVFRDKRGTFLETWQLKRYQKAGIPAEFLQDNVSISKKGTLRGLHYQHPHGQGKLVQVLSGSVFDVAVDIRLGSPTFGKSHSEPLSDSNHKQLYIPPGFAHGFCVLSDTAIFSYKCTEYYDDSAEAGVAWNDPDLKINWPIQKPLLSKKDEAFSRLKDIPRESLPHYKET